MSTIRVIFAIQFPPQKRLSLALSLVTTFVAVHYIHADSKHLLRLHIYHASDFAPIWLGRRATWESASSACFGVWRQRRCGRESAFESGIGPRSDGADGVCGQSHQTFDFNKTSVCHQCLTE